MADIIAVLKANTSDFTAKMAEAKGEVEDLSKSGSSNMSKLSTIGRAAFLGLGAAAIGVGVASIDLADKYQKATNTIAANGNISVASADKIGKAFLGTAGTTIYSAQNIATAFGTVAGQVKLMNGGVLNSKAAMDVMRPAMDLAEASGENLNNTTSDIATTLQAFGLKITQSPLVANVLFNAATQTGVSVDTLSSTIDKARAKMGSAAPSVQQMGGLIVDLASHGETGRAAMSALGSAFTGIITPTAAVTKAQQAMGLSFINAQGQLDPLQQIIAEVGPKIAGMGNAQATATLKSLGFGASATKLLGVIQAGPAAFDKATAAVSRQNSAHEAAEKQAQTLQHQVETLKAAAEDYGVKIGQVLVPMLERFIKVTMSVVEWLGKHKVVLIALGVVIGGVLLVAIAAWTAGVIAAGLASLAAIAPATAFGAAMTDAAISVDASLGPILLVIAAVAVLALAGYEIYKHWGTIANFFKKAWKDVEHIFDDAIDFIKSHIKDFVEILIVVLTGGMALLPALIVRYWSQITNDVHTAWSAIINFFTGIPGKILDALSSLGGDLYKLADDAFEKVLDAFKSAWTDVAGWLKNLWSDIKAAIGDLANDVHTWVRTEWEYFLVGLKDAWNDVTRWLSGIWASIKAAVGDLGTDVHDWVKTEWGYFLVGLKDAWTDVTTWFSNLWSHIKAAIGDLGSKFEQMGKDIIQGLINGLSDAEHFVLDKIKSIGGDIVSGFKSLLGIGSPSRVFYEHGLNIVQGLANGISDNASLATGAMAKLAGATSPSGFGTASLGFNSGITPISSGVTSSGSAGGSLTATVPVNVVMDGNVLGHALQTVVLQAQRGQSQQFFGTTQTAA
jgi:TP901 family phage tail tape measure protein